MSATTSIQVDESDACLTALEEGWRHVSDCSRNDFEGSDEVVMLSAFAYQEPALFNVETKEFSSAATWEDLLKERGIPVYDRDFRIPSDLSEKANRVAREFRAFMAGAVYEDDPPTGGGCTAFRSPEHQCSHEGIAQPRGALFAIIFDGGDIAPLLNLSYECYAAHDQAIQFFNARGVWFENVTHWWGWVYEND